MEDNFSSIENEEQEEDIIEDNDDNKGNKELANDAELKSKYWNISYGKEKLYWENYFIPNYIYFPEVYPNC